MSTLVRFSPEMRRLQREIDTLFDSFFPTRTQNGEPETATWAPRVDLAETEEAYHLYLDLPGLSKDDVEINFHDGALTVRGERKTEKQGEKQNFVRLERTFGHFYRSFTLPKTADAERIEASYQDGVLSIRVPKAEEVKPRRIQVS